MYSNYHTHPAPAQVPTYISSLRYRNKTCTKKVKLGAFIPARTNANLDNCELSCSAAEVLNAR